MKSLKDLMDNPKLKINNVGIDGGSGYIYKTYNKFSPFCSVIWSFGDGWEHVSISPMKHKIIPSWEDMCEVKDIFFEENETVVEYHPAKLNYVNIMQNCLHLWRPTKQELPTPPLYMV